MYQASQECTADNVGCMHAPGLVVHAHAYQPAHGVGQVVTAALTRTDGMYTCPTLCGPTGAQCAKVLPLTHQLFELRSLQWLAKKMKGGIKVISEL